MKVIVDTMNALHKTGVLPPDLAGMDVPGLVQALSRGRWARNQVLLVCDGNPPRTITSRMRVASEPSTPEIGVKPTTSSSS